MMPSAVQPNRPCVAIVGRPNVGKSSLFNRLAGQRLAIVHSERGVTRDRLMQSVTWGGRQFDVVDTGGLGALDAPGDGSVLSGAELERLIRAQVELAVCEASAIILVTDLAAGLVPQDFQAAEFLRRSGKPIIVAANKADDPERDSHAADFAELGFPVFPVSAVHNRGLEALLESLAPLLPAAPAAENPEPALRVAVIGRPNVGKSSFINALLRSERVLVSDLPGTTRDSVDVPFRIGSGAAERRYILTDTAGIRAAGKIRHAVERFSLARASRSLRRADLALLVLDAAQGPTAGDKALAGLIERHHKGCLVLVTKWDLLARPSEAAYRSALVRALPFLHATPMLFVSAKTGRNLGCAVDGMDRIGARISATLPTGPLNRTLARAAETVAPPARKGKRLKLFYATQVGIRPITILLFVNDRHILSDGYRVFLANTLRRAFDLDGAPIVFQLKSRTKAAEPAF